MSSENFMSKIHVELENAAKAVEIADALLRKHSLDWWCSETRGIVQELKSLDGRVWDYQQQKYLNKWKEQDQ